MALSGLHVVSGYAGPSRDRHSASAIIGDALWSETMVAAGTTALAAPAVSDSAGDPIFQVHGSAAVYVCIAGTPNATTGARFYVPADTTREFYAQPGDKLAWVAA